MLGAGKMSELTARYLADQGLRTIVVANRTYAHARELATKLGGEAIHYEALDVALQRVDILISSTSKTAGWHQRTSLELWISADGGNSWPVRRPLVRSYEDGLVICYPHAFIDPIQELIYVAYDTAREHYLFRIPSADVR
ncbi:MAG: sialidase family protein [Armatimonadota bacterium]